MIDAGFKGLFGLAPVVVYLAVLVFMDSYKLVRLRAVILAVAAGAAAVLLCRWLNTALWEATGLPLSSFTRYVAPLTEETAKAAYLAFLIARRRTGFMVDAAILGFAIGTGFGMLENAFYLRLIPDASLFTWVLRGFGTAIMHGSATAIFGIVAHRRSEARNGLGPGALVPALGLAVVLHSGFNHFLVSPALSVAGLILFVPLITYAVFRRSELALEKWLGSGFDNDAEMLAIIGAGKVSETRVGAYLLSLRERFPAEVVVDMFCLLRLQVELSIQSKGLLLMRKEGFAVPPPADVAEKVAELRYLERSIGQTGRIALRPFLHADRKDSWQKHLLQQG